MIADETHRSHALALAQQLRGEGWRVGFPLAQEKVGKQFGTAETLGASHAVVIGAEWPEVKVKRLSDRMEQELDHATLGVWLEEQGAAIS